MDSKIKNHSNYNENDYKYLRAKGWSNKEILARWTQEAARGIGPVTWDCKEAKIKLASILK